MKLMGCQVLVFVVVYLIECEVVVDKFDLVEMVVVYGIGCVLLQEVMKVFWQFEKNGDLVLLLDEKYIMWKMFESEWWVFDFVKQEKGNVFVVFEVIKVQECIVEVECLQQFLYMFG